MVGRCSHLDNSLYIPSPFLLHPLIATPNILEYPLLPPFPFHLSPSPCETQVTGSLIMRLKQPGDTGSGGPREGWQSLHPSFQTSVTCPIVLHICWHMCVCVCICLCECMLVSLTLPYLQSITVFIS